MTPPASTLRLFPDHRPEDLAGDGGRALLVGRLLEEGDRGDLVWLTAAMEEETLAAWVAERAARQLSRRSLAFWSRLLRTPRAAPADEALWPL